MKKKTKKIGKKLKNFTFETRLQSANKFKHKVLELFKDYIKSIIIYGSIVRGDVTGKSDVDTYIIFDDTKMPLKKFESIRDKIDNDIYKIAKSTDPRLHPQPVIALTEFWDGIRKCHPLFYTIVRDGYAIHDTGFFIPLRKLLEWGKFPATIEAAELRMEGVPKRIRRVKNVKNLMIAEDLWYAAMDAGQAVLMYIGVGPPAPKMVGREVRKHLVDAKLLEDKYAKFIEDVHEFRKKVEHKEAKEISGKELDEWIDRADEFVKRMERLLIQLELQKKASDIKKNYEVMIKASVAALKSIDKLPKDPKKLPEAFNKYLVEPGIVNPLYADIFGKVIKMRKLLEDKQIGQIPERDVMMSKEYVRRFVMDARNVMDKKDKVKGLLEEFAKKKDDNMAAESSSSQKNEDNITVKQTAMQKNEDNITVKQTAMQKNEDNITDPKDLTKIGKNIDIPSTGKTAAKIQKEMIEGKMEKAEAEVETAKEIDKIDDNITSPTKKKMAGKIKEKKKQKPSEHKSKKKSKK
ncbi:MAG: nucleotidyltransferase domain-containing protein [Candidatus Aenigmarchaeota archaeon]|nr:nucleotidyltransferase domain-containing protein [Candidatus Aenigmarchaeota archaeon]